MRNTGRSLAAWLALTFFLIPVFAQDEAVSLADQKAPAVAWTTVAQTLVSWEPVQQFEAVTLRVTGSQGLVFSREFPVGNGIVFDLTDDFGNPLPDGSYTWELTGAPRIAGWVRDEMSYARETGQDEILAQQLRASGDLPVRDFTQSGSLTIRDGVALLPDVPEKNFNGGGGWKTRSADPGDQYAAAASPMDQVINDDQIVTGSLCVGFDCVNGESFGFDTVRVKENNLRIHFDDTSNSASFPRRDWRIVANDSTNGGLERFSIEDSTAGRFPFTIEGNAPSNSLYVDDGGRLGIKTSTPVVELHVADGDTPTLRLEQNGSSGFTPQTWDVAGNETNFFVRDVTNGSRLSFKIKPGAPDNSLFVAANGDVGLSTASPEEDLHVRGTDGTTKMLIQEASGTPGNRILFEIRNNGGPQFQFVNTNSGVDWRFLESSGSFIISDVDAVGNQEFVLTGGGTLTVSGDLNANGTKNFVTDDPEDPTRRIYFAALEGPEAGTYFRGTARTSRGESVIELPSYFTKVTEPEGLTVQLTPLGGWHQLYVVEKSPERLVVRVAGDTDAVEFDFLVQGVRKGFSDYQVVRDKVR